MVNNQNGPILVTAATSDPVTLAEAKAYCRVTGDADNAMLTSLIPAATDYVQRLAGLQLLTATLKQTWDGFPDGEFRFDRSPVQSVSSVKYYNADGVLTTIAGSGNWWADLHARPPRIVPASSYSWPEIQDGRPAAVEIEYVAGYTAISLIPPGLLVAVKAVIEHWYKNPGVAITTGGVPFALPHSLDALILLHCRNEYA